MASKLEKAFHEAGHAIAARALGVTVEHISMRPTADSSANVLTWSASWKNKGADVATQISAAETDAMIAIADMIAGKRYLRKKTGAQSLDHDEGAEDDIRNVKSFLVQAAMLAAGMPIPEVGEGKMIEINVPGVIAADVEARYYQLWKATDKLLFDKWRAVKRVANILVHRDHIDQAELDRLIAGE